MRSQRLGSNLATAAQRAASAPAAGGTAHCAAARALPLVLPLLLIALTALPGRGAPAAGDDAQSLTLHIPAATVLLGSDDHERGFGYVYGGPAAWRGRWFEREQPRHEVAVAAFTIDATLVTQSAYSRFVRATGHRPPHISAAEYEAQGFLVHPYTAVQPYLWRAGRPPPGLEAHPVVLVSHGDAATYCAWRGRSAAKSEGRPCGLPTGEQWEYAARGSDGRYFPWGNTWQPHRLNSSERGPGHTTPVQAYPKGRSPFGLYDMAGNVFQWTATPGREGMFMLRGCSWDDQGGICRAAARHDRLGTSRHILIGFRCACEAPRP